MKQHLIEFDDRVFVMNLLDILLFLVLRKYIQDILQIIKIIIWYQTNDQQMILMIVLVNLKEKSGINFNKVKARFLSEFAMQW